MIADLATSNFYRPPETCCDFGNLISELRYRDLVGGYVLMDFDEKPNLYLRTSSWSAESWVGSFYPPGTPPPEFLPFYASRYNTVEVDSTYYRIPSRKMVQGWYDRTPSGFVFAAKFPGEITHKKVLIDCDRETDEFLGVMELLGEKLGPLLLQFPYLNQQVMPNSEEFLSRLGAILCACREVTVMLSKSATGNGWASL